VKFPLKVIHNSFKLAVMHFYHYRFNQLWFHARLKFFVHHILKITNLFHQYYLNQIHDWHEFNLLQKVALLIHSGGLRQWKWRQLLEFHLAFGLSQVSDRCAETWIRGISFLMKNIRFKSRTFSLHSVRKEGYWRLFRRTLGVKRFDVSAFAVFLFEIAVGVRILSQGLRKERNKISCECSGACFGAYS
jgi:hypothetical protein